MQLTGSIAAVAEILGPDIEICVFAIGKKRNRKVFAKAQRSSELSKQKKGRVHRSPLLTTGRCHSECQHHTDPSGLPVCYLITLLISRQTKLRGSFVFSSFLSRILIAPCSCQTPPPGNRRCSGPPGPGPSLRSPASCR